MDVSTELLMRLSATRIPFAQIATECGVSERWLYAVLANEIREPGLSRGMRVLDFLAAHENKGEHA